MSAYASVSIASLGIDLPVIDGGQAVIDQGVVAHYIADGWEPPVAAGDQGTYWLAAHHETHGSPFADLPDIAVGAEIRVNVGGRTFVYTVTSKEVVGLLPGDAAVYGTDPTARVILLQTCLDETRRALIHGILTSTE
jgi:LPXTG-site transpeptidase (sortase) family protein